MHAFCLVVTKTPRRAQQIIEGFCEDGVWDYASVGGRYEHIIPVSHRTKDNWPQWSFGRTPEDYPPNGFPYGNALDNNPHCKYINGARIRNINRDEVNRIAARRLVNVFNPYSYILDMDEYASREYFAEEDSLERLWSFINNPAHSYYYLVVVDYHF